MVGLNNLGGISQPQWFYDSMILILKILIFKRKCKKKLKARPDPRVNHVT